MKVTCRPFAGSTSLGSVSSRVLTYAGVVAAVVIVVVAVVALMMAERPERETPRDAFAELEAAWGIDSPDSRPQVEVLNGCGVSGIAARAHEYLRRLGFDVVNVENAPAFDYEKTLVIDRGGDEGIARRVARFLGTDNVIRQVRPELMLQVTVILGKDYRSLKPYGEVEP
ncbi:MAG: LytR C-terminal domain-containing protein [Candidatus Latescibacteria bacterium]|nr:LytR C-terminal domain-containing protein [Candidatus Latescibacterota bacterium]